MKAYIFVLVAVYYLPLIQPSFVNGNDVNSANDHVNVTLKNPFTDNISYEREDLWTDIKYFYIRVLPILYQFFVIPEAAGGKVALWKRFLNDFIQMILPALT
ncbi:4132_t:CDS:1, partial [Acaulospora morrowiae]